MAKDAAGMNTQTPIERALEILAQQDPPPTQQKTIPCPHPDHDDRHPSAVLYPDGGWMCFGCNQWGSALDLYALRNGLTIRQALDRLDCFKDWTPPRKPQPRKVYMPESVKEILLASSEFAERWEAAKLLAQLEPAQQKQDILANWDYLEPFDIPETLKLAGLIRGVALFRYGEAVQSRPRTKPEIPDDAVVCDDGRVLVWREDRWERIDDIKPQENPLDIAECVRRLIRELKG